MKLTAPKAVLVASAGILAIAASGCATKKYVSQQIAPVKKQVNQANAQLTKQQSEISYLNEQMTTANNKIGAVGALAEQANNTASQALQGTQQNASAIQSQSSQLESQASQIEMHSSELVRLGNEFDYSVVDTVNVTFPTSRWQLTATDRAKLDELIRKSASTPRAVFEVTGFTDDTGPASYNLTLSRRRAEAVARYLVSKDVPVKSISLLGMGKEQTHQMLAADFEGFNPNAPKREIRAMARRVRIRLLAPGAASSTASTESSGSSSSSSSVN